MLSAARSIRRCTQCRRTRGLARYHGAGRRARTYAAPRARRALLVDGVSGKRPKLRLVRTQSELEVLFASMDRRSAVLAALAPAMGAAHSPVQVQKTLFLIDKEISKLIGGPFFDFQPYDYGPFDKAVYDVLEELTRAGLVEVEAGPGLRWRRYRLTAGGQREGSEILESLDRRASDYIKKISEFVRSLSFEDLVSAIYKAYPDMKVNSIFKG